MSERVDLRSMTLNELKDFASSIRVPAFRGAQIFDWIYKGKKSFREQSAKRLAGLLKGKLCHVNLIPLNEVKDSGFVTVSKSKAFEFQKALEEAGIPATIRRELGDDIDAACGQLRLNNE